MPNPLLTLRRLKAQRELVAIVDRRSGTPVRREPEPMPRMRYP